MFDVVMIGAGIVGLATARELQLRHPELRIAVVDKETVPGRHQSGHNSGVLHAGVYYKPRSLKARLCVEGKALIEQFAHQHDVKFETCGKLIVALSSRDLGPLDDIAERARANGVTGTRMVSPEEMREIEPHAVGVRALHVPLTGIIDFQQVVRVLQRLLTDDGATMFLGHEVREIQRRTDHQVIITSRGAIETRKVISCAGLHADRIAALTSTPDVQVLPFRGDYYTLQPEARHLCQGLIYPVPDPALPFLGAHFTKRYDGEVWAGPNAVLALKREGYQRLGLNARDLFETVRFRGFRRLAQTYWRAGAEEIWRDAVKSAFVKNLQRYVPEVRGDQLTFGPSGVRAQAVDRNGALVDDFQLAVDSRSLHVLNAPSPGATASLAIAKHLCTEAEKAFVLNQHASGDFFTNGSRDKRQSRTGSRASPRTPRFC